MESAGLLQRKLGALRNQTGHIVIKEEENGQEDPKPTHNQVHSRGKVGRWGNSRHCQKYIAGAESPEVNQPPSLRRRRERPPNGQVLQRYGFHLANVLVDREEYDCEGRAVVLKEDPDGMRKQGALADDTGYVSKQEDQQCDGDREVCGRFASPPLQRENLDALLDIYKGHVEPAGSVRRCWARRDLQAYPKISQLNRVTQRTALQALVMARMACITIDHLHTSCQQILSVSSSRVATHR